MYLQSFRRDLRLHCPSEVIRFYDNLSTEDEIFFVVVAGWMRLSPQEKEPWLAKAREATTKTAPSVSVKFERDADEHQEDGREHQHKENDQNTQQEPFTDCKNAVKTEEQKETV